MKKKIKVLILLILLIIIPLKVEAATELTCDYVKENTFTKNYYQFQFAVKDDEIVSTKVYYTWVTKDDTNDFETKEVTRMIDDKFKEKVKKGKCPAFINVTSANAYDYTLSKGNKDFLLESANYKWNNGINNTSETMICIYQNDGSEKYTIEYSNVVGSKFTNPSIIIDGAENPDISLKFSVEESFIQYDDKTGRYYCPSIMTISKGAGLKDRVISVSKNSYGIKDVFKFNSKNSSSKAVTDDEVHGKFTTCIDINSLNDKATAKALCKAGINNRDKNYVCVWNDDYNFCNVDNLTYVKCGDIYDIPSQVPSIIYFVITLLKIATPIILVIVGVITLFKAMTAAKEDEMKKAQSSLIKKIIYAALVFFVVSIVQFVISLVAEDSDKEGFTSCFNCFLNNNCESTMYYKTVIGDQTTCTYLNGKTCEYPNK